MVVLVHWDAVPVQQNLFSVDCKGCYVSLPYSVNSFLEESGPRAFADKGFHLVKFFYAAGRESLRIMKHKIWVTLEDHPVFDVVCSALGTH